MGGAGDRDEDAGAGGGRVRPPPPPYEEEFDRTVDRAGGGEVGDWAPAPLSRWGREAKYSSNKPKKASCRNQSRVNSHHTFSKDGLYLPHQHGDGTSRPDGSLTMIG